MSPLVTKILLSLCASFVLGTLVGWLARQLFIRFTTRKERGAWKEQLRQQREDATATRHLVHKQGEVIQGLQDQLTGANTALRKLETVLATTKKELKLKIAELVHLEGQLKEAEEKAAQTNATVSEEQQLVGQLEADLKALRLDLETKAATNIQLTQQIKEQDNLSEKLREQEASQLLLRSRLEFTLRTKENEIQQLQQRLATIEAEHTQLLEKNGNLSHSCARYQSDLHTATETIERLRAELATFAQGDSSADSPTRQFSRPDLREHMKVQEKDEENARLRARVAGLQLLLRHGVGRPRSVATGAPVVVEARQK